MYMKNRVGSIGKLAKINLVSRNLYEPIKVQMYRENRMGAAVLFRSYWSSLCLSTSE